VYTSGTTGRAKAVITPHGNLALNCLPGTEPGAGAMGSVLATESPGSAYGAAVVGIGALTSPPASCSARGTTSPRRAG
jgi:acyl-coenzyme A synthetase/AMP-(fatty) acid ligase